MGTSHKIISGLKLCDEQQSVLFGSTTRSIEFLTLHPVNLQLQHTQTPGKLLAKGFWLRFRV